jgi:hypothetical protein
MKLSQLITALTAAQRNADGLDPEVVLCFEPCALKKASTGKPRKASLM